MQASPTDRLLNLFKQEINTRCLHCGRASKQWAELTYAIFLCLDCAAAFRQFSWLTQIKSVNLDQWSIQDVQRMEKGGNQSFSNFLRQYGIELADIRVKVTSRASKYYRGMLDGKTMGQQPSVEEGKLVDKEEIPFGEMNSDELFDSAKEKALWLGGKTKELGQKGVKKVQQKWQSGEIQAGAKDIAQGVSTRAQWLWGKVRGKIGELSSKDNKSQTTG